MITKYFTILIIIYNCQGQELTTKVMFRSSSECSIYLTKMLAPLREVYDQADGYCIPTREKSTTVLRPRSRPKSGVIK